MRMRLASSNRALAVLFHRNNKRVVFHIIGQVRIALMKDFVPLHLGLQHIDHQVAIDQHQTDIAHTTKPHQFCWFTDTSARDITAPTLLRRHYRARHYRARHYRARLLRALTLERINIIAHDTSADDICAEFFLSLFYLINKLMDINQGRLSLFLVH